MCWQTSSIRNSNDEWVDDVYLRTQHFGVDHDFLAPVSGRYSHSFLHAHWCCVALLALVRLVAAAIAALILGLVGALVGAVVGALVLAATTTAALLLAPLL